MIMWMQKHKKWLVITIWISTIAFVGAGFVGWGSYDYNKSGSGVATVGSKEIKNADLQEEYSRLYNQYQQTFGDTFNKELADQLKLQEQAYNNLVQKFLILNHSDELGLDATQDEVVKELVAIPSFLKDGKFDKKTYIQVLQQNRTNPSDFEEQVRQNIVLSKLQNIYRTKSNDNTTKSLNELFLSWDRVSINIIDKSSIVASSTQEDQMSYWEKNKDNYKSIKKYKVNVEKVLIGDDEKQSKKDALKKYLSIKKGNSKFNDFEIMDESVITIDAESLNKIFTSKLNTVLKPIKTNTHYLITKLIEIQEPSTLPYADVIDRVKADLIVKAKEEIVNKQRDELMKDFKGTEIGFINKETQEINGLSKEETQELINTIFTSTQVINFAEVQDKVIVFKILESKLGNYNKANDVYISSTITNMKDNEVMSSLVQKLQTKYEVISNLQKN